MSETTNSSELENIPRATKRVAMSPLRMIGVCCALAATVFMIGAVFTSHWWLHHLTPSPDGLIMQIELRESIGYFGSPEFAFHAIDRDGPAISIFDKGSTEFPSALMIVRFPTGKVLLHVDRPSKALREEVLAQRWQSAGPRFDFDGDGIEDRAPAGKDGHVSVISGADLNVLWTDFDPLEYETDARLTRLGDLDGDGCAELAVLHPREDRSDYDLEPFDLLFGAKSWLSIVSGGRAIEAQARTK